MGLIVCLTAHSAVVLGAVQNAPRVTLKVIGPARLQIEGVRETSEKRWSFLDSYAGISNLSDRIANLELRDAGGAPCGVRRVAGGEYETERAAVAYKYDIDLRGFARDDDFSHASWLGESFGLLALGDLLPLSEGRGRSLSLSLELPAGWDAATLEKESASRRFDVTAADEAVFYIGKGLQKITERVEGLSLTIALAPEQVFSPREIIGSATQIIREQKRITGVMPRRGDAMVMLIPFPRTVPAGQWSAETRGGTVIYVAGRNSSKIAALAEINVTLAHELFHLWVPHGLRLSGQYDWFYEGFTLYQAMRVALRLGDLTFADYLSALGRAYDKYRQGARNSSPELSLIEASRRRWDGQALYVYNKGMVAAFLYDLTLRQRSGGKLTIDDAYRDLFRRHGESEVDGNEAALASLNRLGGMGDFTRTYVENGAAVDLASAVTAFGLTVVPHGARTEVKVSDTLTQEQKKILSQFGYAERNLIRQPRRPKAI